MQKRIFFLLLLFPTLLLVSCSTRQNAISPQRTPLTESVYASGIIKSKNQYQVYSKTNGIVAKVMVDEGTHVKKGAILFILENANAKLATRNATLASKANDIVATSDQLEDATNKVALARKTLQKDSLLYERQLRLWEQNIGSKVELEQKELNFENAKVSLKNAKIRYADLKRQLELASGQANNNLKIAKLQEDDFIIRSQNDGVVYSIEKEAGEFVSPQNPIAVIGEDDFLIELSIDEYDIVKIKKGQEVIIRMDSYKEQVFEARISSINPMMNTRTRTFTGTAMFTKAPPQLFPNLTAEANIIIHTKEGALTLPREYLIEDSIVVLQGGTKQTVKTGLKDYQLVEILDGIDENSKIELPQQ